MAVQPCLEELNNTEPRVLDDYLADEGFNSSAESKDVHVDVRSAAGTCSKDGKEKGDGRPDVVTSSTGGEPVSATFSLNISWRRLVPMLIGLYFGIMLVGLGASMMANISSIVAGTFNALDQLTWVATTYWLGESIAQPISAHLTNLFGRKPGLVVSYGAFALGTLLCGLSAVRAHAGDARGGLACFLAGRLTQGLGGGALVTIVSFIESDVIPLKDRGLVEGAGNVLFGIVNALGGLYGGAFAGGIGWQWAFLVQPPLILANVVLVLLTLPHIATIGTTTIEQKVEKDEELASPESRTPSILTETRPAVDVVGIITVLCATVFFQLALTRGSTTSWADPLTIASFCISATSLAIFLYWDYVPRTPNPLIPLRQLCQRTIAGSQSSCFFNSMSSACIEYYLPIYLQILGASPSSAGLRFIPYSGAFGLSSFLTGWWVRRARRYWVQNLVVQACAVGGAAGLVSLSSRTPSCVPYLLVSLVGAGFGGITVTRLMGLLAATKQENQATVLGASWTISSTGSAVGIAVAGGIFQRMTRSALAVLLSGRPDVLATLLSDGFSGLDGVYGQLKDEVLQVYMDGIRAVFALALGVQVAAALCSFLMENKVIVEETKKNHNESGTIPLPSPFRNDTQALCDNIRDSTPVGEPFFPFESKSSTGPTRYLTPTAQPYGQHVLRWLSDFFSLDESTRSNMTVRTKPHIEPLRPDAPTFIALFFPAAETRRPVQVYLDRIRTLANMGEQTIIYLPPSLSSAVKSMRSDPHWFVIDSYTSIWDMPNNAYQRANFDRIQPSLWGRFDGFDPKRNDWTPNPQYNKAHLSAAFNAKAFVSYDAVLRNPFGCERWMYVDAGIFDEVGPLDAQTGVVWGQVLREQLDAAKFDRAITVSGDTGVVMGEYMQSGEHGGMELDRACWADADRAWQCHPFIAHAHLGSTLGMLNYAVRYMQTVDDLDAAGRYSAREEFVIPWVAIRYPNTVFSIPWTRIPGLKHKWAYPIKSCFTTFGGPESAPAIVDPIATIFCPRYKSRRPALVGGGNYRKTWWQQRQVAWKKWVFTSGWRHEIEWINDKLGLSPL
ncbi:major facilitator superfamily domain-containing protein [Xylariales sp. PMI_506]|nr:major facilitator superfamily domain-containing protein [Xylariales sp. PMI_506]